MLSVDDWIHIRDVAHKGISVSDMARQTGRDRKTIHKVLTEKAPQTQRSASSQRASKLDPDRAYLQQRIAEGCLNGAVLLEEISRQGYSGKISIVRGMVTPLRQEQTRQREATERFETTPGKQAQVDWAKFGRIWVPEVAAWQVLYAFLDTLGYSRAAYLEFVTCCDMEHFLDCHLNAFGALGIADSLLYDNLKLDFALAHGFTPKFCRPYRARTKEDDSYCTSCG